MNNLYDYSKDTLEVQMENISFVEGKPFLLLLFDYSILMKTYIYFCLVMISEFMCGRFQMLKTWRRVNHLWRIPMKYVSFRRFYLVILKALIYINFNPLLDFNNINDDVIINPLNNSDPLYVLDGVCSLFFNWLRWKFY